MTVKNKKKKLKKDKTADGEGVLLQEFYKQFRLTQNNQGNKKRRF